MAVEIFQKRHLENLAVLFARLNAAIDDILDDCQVINSSSQKRDLSEAFQEAVITHLEYHTGEKYNESKFRERYLKEYLQYRKEIDKHGLSILRP